MGFDMLELVVLWGALDDRQEMEIEAAAEQTQEGD